MLAITQSNEGAGSSHGSPGEVKSFLGLFPGFPSSRATGANQKGALYLTADIMAYAFSRPCQ